MRAPAFPFSPALSLVHVPPCWQESDKSEFEQTYRKGRKNSGEGGGGGEGRNRSSQAIRYYIYRFSIFKSFSICAGQRGGGGGGGVEGGEAAIVEIHARSNWFSFHEERKRIDDDEGKKLKEGFERLVLLLLFFFLNGISPPRDLNQIINRHCWTDKMGWMLSFGCWKI